MFNDTIRKLFEQESNNLLLTNAMYCLILDRTADILRVDNIPYNPEARSFNLILTVNDDKREYLLTIQKDMNMDAVVTTAKENNEVVGSCVAGINGGYKTTMGRMSNPRIRMIFTEVINAIADIAPADVEAKASELIRQPETPRVDEVDTPDGVQEAFAPATPITHEEKENAVDTIYQDATESEEKGTENTGGVRDIRDLGPQVDTLLRNSGPIETARKFTEMTDTRKEIRSSNPLDS